MKLGWIAMELDSEHDEQASCSSVAADPLKEASDRPHIDRVFRKTILPLHLGALLAEIYLAE